ncbi:MAG: hypothetical protein ACU0C9_05160 [Paracoccaceae bacterium]
MLLRSASQNISLNSSKFCLVFAIFAFALIGAEPAFSKNSNENANANAREQSEEPDSVNEKNNSRNKKNNTDEDTDSQSEENSSNGEIENDDDEVEKDDGNDIVLNAPPKNVESIGDRESESSDSGTSILFRSDKRVSRVEAKFLSAKEELARLFVLTTTEISVEFPAGGFDQALVQAANRARRTERAYRHKG